MFSTRRMIPQEDDSYHKEHKGEKAHKAHNTMDNTNIYRNISSKEHNQNENHDENRILSKESKQVMVPHQQVYCTKCHGEGQIISYRKQKKRIQSCLICQGTGLVKDPQHNHDHYFSSPFTTPTPFHFHVSIIGGGIGGFALALALQQRKIPYTIYERDSCFEERSQGYGLTMQQGGKALNALGFTTIGKERLMGKGIHSKRHLVHTPDGQRVGAWGLKVWGRSSKRIGMDGATTTTTSATAAGTSTMETSFHDQPQQKEDEDTITIKEAKRQNVHISRQELRRLLYDQILDKEKHIRWGHKLLSYQEHESSSVSMKFQIQSNVSTSSKSDTNDILSTSSTLLVGADGIRSQVRAQKIPNDICPLRYLDCIVILGIASSPQSSTLTSDNETVFQTADGTTRLYAMPFSARGKETAMKSFSANDRSNISCADGVGETMWQLSFPLSEMDAKELSSKGATALKEEALNRVGQWHIPIPDLIQSTPLELISGYPVYDRDLIDEDTFRYGGDSNCGSIRNDNNLDTTDLKSSLVTLIGDAAHPMSPFKGQGANQALLDSVSLARSIHRAYRKIIKTEKDTHTTITQNINLFVNSELKEFEKEMLRRSSTKIQASLEAAKFLHTDVAIAEGNRTRAAIAAMSKKLS